MYLWAEKFLLNLGSRPDPESGSRLWMWIANLDRIQFGGRLSSLSAPVILFEILAAELLSCLDLPLSDCSASCGIYRHCM